MSDAYNIRDALLRTAGVAKLQAALKKMQAAGQLPTGGGGGGRNYGGGQGPVASPVPVSTLAGFPQTPGFQDLVAKGIIREGMPPEQIQAILAIQGMTGNVPIDVTALTDRVKADYENYTGDILNSGAEWMQNLYGTVYDPNDPNAALFAQDPIFSSYAGGLAQMDETADTNLATDLAWFQKQEQAQQQYYNQLMADISAYGLPLQQEEAAGSGGGGGGGGGYGGGRRGGGGGSGSDTTGPVEWDLNDVDLRDQETIYARGGTTAEAENPGFWKGAQDIAATPEQLAWINNIISTASGQDPQGVGAALVDEFATNAASIEANRQILEGNTAWNAAAPDQFELLINQYGNLTNRGDNPETAAVERFWENPNAEPQVIPEGYDQPGMQALYNQAYAVDNLPVNPERYRAGVEQLINSNIRPLETPSFDFDTQKNVGNFREALTAPSGDISYEEYENTINPINLLNMTPEQIANTTQEQLQDIPTEIFNRLSPEQFDALPVQAEFDEFGGGEFPPSENQWDYLPQSERILSEQSRPGKGGPLPTPLARTPADLVEMFQAAYTEASDNTYSLPKNVINARNRAAARSANAYISGKNAPRSESGELRPDLLEMMQAASWEDYTADRQNAAGMSDEEFNATIQPGTYYNVMAPTEEEIRADEEEQVWNQMYQDYAMELNPNYQMNTTSDYLNENATQQSSITDTSDTENPLAFDLAGQGDPNQLTLDQIDLVDDAPLGFAGQSIPLAAFAGTKGTPVGKKTAKTSIKPTGAKEIQMLAKGKLAKSKKTAGKSLLKKK